MLEESTDGVGGIETTASSEGGAGMAASKEEAWAMLWAESGTDGVSGSWAWASRGTVSRIAAQRNRLRGEGWKLRQGRRITGAAEGEIRFLCNWVTCP